MEADGSVRIAWEADGYEAIHVYAQFWPAPELGRFAGTVADIALTNRTLADLRRGMRREYLAAYDMEAPDADAPDRRVAIRFLPPPGEPNPDPIDF